MVARGRGIEVAICLVLGFNPSCLVEDGSIGAYVGFRSSGIKGLRLRLVLFPHAYVGPLVVYRRFLIQLPLQRCGIVIITVKVLVRH